MDAVMHGYPFPRRMLAADGTERTVGIELEFAGLELEDIARIVIELYGGHLVPVSRFECRAADTALGTFRIEIDLMPLKRRSHLRLLDRLGLELEPESLRHAEDVLARVAGTLIPHEIASPPLAMHLLPCLERLRARLQAAHARGTKALPHYAFGLQFNPEIPARDATTILNYLRPFLLLADWLEQQGRIALARRLSSFISAFPLAYARSVLQPDYAPGLGQLIDDYALANPTRNRPLDLLPLFAYLAPARLRRELAENRIKINPCPTLHYRLPNCLIDEPDWTLAREWAGWVAVDNLAQSPGKIAAMSEDFLARRGHVMVGYDESWAQRVAQEWLQAIIDPSSA